MTTADEYSPSNFRATVDGSTVHLAWDPPAHTSNPDSGWSSNAYVIIITTNELKGDLVYYYTDSPDYNPEFEYLGTNQHNFYNLPNGTYYVRVALGICDKVIRTTCRFSSIGGYTPSFVFEVQAATAPDPSIYRSAFEFCKNPPAHSFDCIDRYVMDHSASKLSDFKLSEERFNFGCLEGFVKKGNECVAGNGESSTVILPKKSVGKPDLTISASKASLVTRKVKGVAKKQYKIGVTVSNKSTGDATGDIYFSVSDNAPVLVAKGGLKAGMSKKVFVYTDTADKGKSFLFTVDPGNTVDESNENNNTATRVVGK